MKKCMFLVMVVFCTAIFSKVNNSGMIFGFQSDYITVDNIPLRMRNVPIHPKDDFVSPDHEGPILRDSYKTVPNGVFGYQLCFVSDSGSTTRLRFLIPISTKEDMQERNYTNDVGSDHRGYGAALTYCMLSKRGILASTGIVKQYGPIIDITPEVYFEKPISEYLSGDLSVGYFCLDFINGWDRYDRYQYRKGYIIAHCFPIALNLNLHNDILFINGGPRLICPIKSVEESGLFKLGYLGWSLNMGVTFQ